MFFTDDHVSEGQKHLQHSAPEAAAIHQPAACLAGLLINTRENKRNFVMPDNNFPVSLPKNMFIFNLRY